MKKTTVRGFRGKALGANDQLKEVFYALPDFGDRPQLFSCMACGALFGAPGKDQDYSKTPLEIRIKGIACPECKASPLSERLKEYPKTFRASDGTQRHFEPSREYPAEEVKREVWDLSE